MSSFYLCAGFSARPYLQQVRDMLIAEGHAVTSRWLDCDVPGDERDHAHYAKWGPIDVEDVNAADIVILFTGLRGRKGGCDVEFGMGLALGKKLVIVGDRTNVFTRLPQVLQVSDAIELLLHFTPYPQYHLPEEGDRDEKHYATWVPVYGYDEPEPGAEQEVPDG